uniref:Bacteriophage tail tape measure C-terminal domain-containing protein n=1 Tax=Conchiformibius kuhniae TaxID=211502 RepID=A0A8T9MYS9_9NEIS|nr:hypothetical protein LVJ77_03870 [Conchiformibius kuhniae]
MREQVTGLVVNSAGRMSDALADFVATGKTDFRSFAQSVLQDISKMTVKMAVFNAMKYAGQSMAGQGGWVGALVPCDVGRLFTRRLHGRRRQIRTRRHCPQRRIRLKPRKRPTARRRSRD